MEIPFSVYDCQGTCIPNLGKHVVENNQTVIKYYAIPNADIIALGSDWNGEYWNGRSLG